MAINGLTPRPGDHEHAVPVQRRTISSEIRDRLLEAIRTGELQPGSPVPAERQLCEQFGVARTSVREAIQGLTASGYLERSRQPARCCRATTRDSPRRRLGDARRTQGAGSTAVRGAAHDRADDVGARGAGGRRCRARADIAELAAEIVRRLDEFRTVDRAFHTAISRACGNPLLQEVYGKTLGALFDSGELASLLYAEINRREVSDIIASSTAAHRAIADALVAGRRKATIGAVQAHLDDVERRMIDQLL